MKKYHLNTLVHIEATTDITEEELNRVNAKWGTVENACRTYSDQLKENLLEAMAPAEAYLRVAEVTTVVSEEDEQ